MELLREIIIGNFGVWIVIISLLIALIGTQFKDKYVKVLFFIYLMLLIIVDIVDILDGYFRIGDVLNNWRYVSSSTGYILRPAIIVVIIFIMLRREKQSKFIWVITIPLIIEILLIVSSPFTKWVFSFSSDNYFHRGPLGFLPHIISAFYVVLLLVLSFVYSFKFDKAEFLTICLIALFAVVATLLESFFNFNYLLTQSLTASCLMYYVYFYIRQSRIDALTGALNRECFIIDMKHYSKSTIAIIMVDLNGLKNINDTYGHEEGDFALMTLARALRRQAKNDYRIYRFGGDEFVVAGVNKDEIDVNKFITKVKEELKGTRYMASFGYSFYNSKKDFDDTLKESDEAMYKDKKHYIHR